MAPVSEAPRDREMRTTPEEIQLAQNGDIEVRNKIIEDNLGLVPIIAKHFVNRGLDLDDLIGEGRLGLFKAISHYDLTSGVAFNTYAGYWIKESIRKALRRTGCPIHLSNTAYRLLTLWRRAERKLFKELGYTPSNIDIMSSLNLTDMQRSMMEKALATTYISQSMLDIWDTSWIEEALIDEEMIQRVHKALFLLETRDSNLLFERYGILNGKEKSCIEISKEQGVCRYTVHKNVNRAQQQLRKLL